jgi:hypothetical protein
MRRQSEALRAETNARILAAFPAELTSYRTARELAAATGMADSTLGPRLHELIADGQLVQDVDGIHRPRPGRRWDWEIARASGERQLEEHVKREDLASARQTAKQRVNATLALLQEASQTVGSRAAQSSAIAGDAAVLMELVKRLEHCVSVRELAMLVDDAFAALRSPIEKWTEATRQRERLAQLAQAELERSWSQWAPDDFRCAHGLPPGAAHQDGQSCPVPEWVLGRKGSRRTVQPASDLFGRLGEAFRAEQESSKPFALPLPTKWARSRRLPPR